MRTLQSYTASPAQQKLNNSSFSDKYAGSRSIGDIQYGKDGKRATQGFARRNSLDHENGDPGRMFDLFEKKAEVEILDSLEDDKLAASVYGDAKRSKRKKPKKNKKGVSGYNFDSLIKDDSSSSTNMD